MYALATVRLACADACLCAAQSTITLRQLLRQVQFALQNARLREQYSKLAGAMRINAAAGHETNCIVRAARR